MFIDGNFKPGITTPPERDATPAAPSLDLLANRELEHSPKRLTIGPHLGHSSLILSERGPSRERNFILRSSAEYERAKNSLSDALNGRETFPAGIGLKKSFNELYSMAEDKEYTDSLTVYEKGELYAMTGVLLDNYTLRWQFPSRLHAHYQRLTAISYMWKSTGELNRAISDLPPDDDIVKWKHRIAEVEYLRGKTSEEIGINPSLDPGNIPRTWSANNRSDPRRQLIDADITTRCFGFYRPHDNRYILVDYDDNGNTKPIKPLTSQEITEVFKLPAHSATGTFGLAA